jgi:hypothetical protein
MRTLRLQRRAAATVLVAALAVLAIGWTANALLRPGCSLLPVSIPDDPSSQNHAASSEEACAVLGRPLPHATVLPDGVRESWMSISYGAPAGIPRMVSVAYAKDGRNILLLTVHKGNEIPPGNLSEVNSTVAGVPAIVQQVHLPSIDADDVHYLWVRDGLLLSLHVQLAPGISRQAADAMAASIR